jgi:hypothetical protein
LFQALHVVVVVVVVVFVASFRLIIFLRVILFFDVVPFLEADDDEAAQFILSAREHKQPDAIILRR